MWSWNEVYSDDWTHGVFDTKEEAIQDALGCLDYIKRHNHGNLIIHLPFHRLTVIQLPCLKL